MSNKEKCPPDPLDDSKECRSSDTLFKCQGAYKSQQHLLIMLSTTIAILLLMGQVECGTCFFNVGLLQSDMGGHLIMGVGIST